MSAKKCTYSNKFKYLLETLSQSLSPEDFKSFVEQKFENADQVISEFQSNLGAGKKESQPKAPEEKSLNRTIESSDKDSLTSLYIGKSQDLNNLRRTFAKKIVESSIYNLKETRFVSANGPSDVPNLNNLNKNIAKYKYDLINQIYLEIQGDSIPKDYTISGQEFSALIESAKLLYENASEDKKNTLRDTYSILSKFDDLIKSNTPFIRTKRNYQDSEYQHIDQYEYTGPNVEHFYKFSSSEYADAFEQASDLADILLDIFPELDARNIPIPNTSIGLQGFTSAMASLKTTLMYPPSELQTLSKELKKGAQMDMSNVLTQYIDWVSNVSNVNDRRKTYLISKLRSIKKNIYESDIDQDIKDMFTAMFFKNVPITYVSYQLDPTTNLIEGKNLRDSLVNIQKYRLQDVIASSIAVFRKDPNKFKKLLTDYNIVDDGKGKITFTTDEGDEATISYEYNNGRYTFRTSDDLDEATTKKIIQDLVSYVLPDDYQRISEQINSQNTSIFKAFAPVLGMIITAGNINSKLNYEWTKSGLFDFKSYHTTLDGIANTLSVLFGSDTISVIKNLEGNSVPTTQLISLAQNVPAMMNHLEDAVDQHQKRTGKERYNMYEDNLIVRNREMIGQPYIRSNIEIGGEVKSPSDLTTTELMNIAIFSDFYNNIDKDKVEFQSTTFADKGTHYVIPFNIKDDVDVNGTWVNIKELIQNCINNGDNTGLVRVYSTLRATKMEKVVTNILQDWSDAFGQTFTSLDSINSFIVNNQLSEADIQKAFKDAHIDLFENIHYYKDGKSKKILMNETIYNWYNTFNNPEKVKKRLNNQKRIFLQQLLDNDITFNKFRNNSAYQLSGNSNFSTWFYQNSGDMILAKTKKGEKITKYNIAQFLANDPEMEIVLNPLLEAYFLSDIILSNEYNSLTLGEVYAHPNKNKEGGLYKDDYFEYSEANRLIAQNKRAVIMGATYHPFLQGMKHGVAETINIAVLKDIPATVWNMIGEEKRDLDSMDGSGISSPLQARMENVSLCDANVGYDKKTIMGDVDAIYGRPTLLKWAVYALTNARRQMSQTSNMSGEQLFKKMHNIPIGKKIDLVRYFNTKNKDLYYFDKETQTWRYIQGIVKKENSDGTVSYTRMELVTDRNGTILDIDNVIPVEVITKKPEDITLYDIDQLFGGAYTAELDSNQKLVYAETNLDILMNIVADEDLKDKFIAYAVNKSAIKVGAGNVNDTSHWMDDSNLDTITMSTAFGGVQMNADHEIDEAEVTEMTQMLSSLVQNGYSLGIVNNVYNDIGKLVVEALGDFYDAINDKDSVKLYRLLGQALVDAFINNDRDTIGLAQAFVMKANQSLQDNSLQYRIPFSAPTINGAFIATIISLINKSGIRRKYSGFAGVLNPSYNYIQYYRIGDSTMDYNTLAKRIYNVREDLRLNQPNNPWINAKIDDFINKAFLPDTNGNVVRNPFLNRLNTVWQADFEDTIVVFDTETKKLHTVYIDSWDKYDYLKNFLTQYGNRFTFYNWTTKPKNLKQSNTRFKVGADWYSIYDINSVRVSHYLQNNPSDEIIKLTKDIFGISDLEILPFIMNYRNQVIDKFNVDKVSKGELLKTARKGTEEFLKALENKTAISDIYVFGDGNDTFQTNEYTVDPAEIIIGRKDAAKFGLEDDENISDVLAKGEEFFISKLNWQYQLPEVNSDLYDVVLYTDEGEQILVKYGSEQEIQQQFAKVAGFSKNEDFQINENKVYFKGEEFTSPDGKNFYSFLDNAGHRHHVITVNTLDRIQELVNNQQVELARTNYQSKNWRKLAELNRDSLVQNPNFQYDINLQNQDQRKFIKEEEYQLQRKFKHLAKKRFDAFQKSLYLVGARIPTQGMQSYMPMKVVMLTNSKINDIYVPRVQTWLEGSDYDKYLVVVKFS